MTIGMDKTDLAHALLNAADRLVELLEEAGKRRCVPDQFIARLSQDLGAACGLYGIPED